MTKVRVVRHPERDIKADIKKYLSSRGVFWLPTKGTAHTRPGDPDLVACYRGLFIGIEGKTYEGSQHGEQGTRQEGIEASEGYYIIARSVDDVRAVLDEIDRDMAKLEEMVEGDP